MGLFSGSKGGGDVKLTVKEKWKFCNEKDPKLFGVSRKDWKAAKDAEKKGK